MKNKLTHNLGLKIMAVLFAAVLWMISMDINDPVTAQKYPNITVQLVNTGSITGKNQTYKVLNSSDIVTVTVRAPKSVITENITRENIVAKADLSKMNEDFTIPIEVGFSETYLESSVESIVSSKEFVELEIENKKTEQLSIEVLQTGTLPAGYTTGRISTDTNTISISGPESVIDPVKRAVVEVSLDDVTSDINMQTQIRLLDEDGNEINNTNIKKNIESVKVTVPILRTKEVAVSYQITGTPDDGYMLTGTTGCVPETVVIAGKESVLAEIEQIEIPASELDVTEARESVSRTVNISKYLPANVSLGDSRFDGNVTLTAEIEAIRRKTVNVTEGIIQKLNVPDGWIAEILPDQGLQVTLRGLQRNLADVSETSLVPHVDVASILDENGNAVAGVQEIVVKFIIPEAVQQEGTLRALIRLTEIGKE